MLHSRDVTHEPDSRARAGYPDEIRALSSAGFTLVARLVTELDDIHSASEVYRQPDRQWFVENANRPWTLMVSSDGHTLADISAWFGGEPSVRLWTSFADGSLVQTNRRLSRGPFDADPTTVWHPLRGHAPAGGRSLALVDGGVPAIWAAHQERVASWARDHGAPSPVDGVRTFETLRDRVVAHGIRWEHRAFALGARFTGLFAIVLTCLLAAAAAVGVPWTRVLGMWLVGGVLIWMGAPFLTVVGRKWVVGDPPAYVGPTRGGVDAFALASWGVAALALAALGWGASTGQTPVWLAVVMAVVVVNGAFGVRRVVEETITWVDGVISMPDPEIAALDPATVDAVADVRSRGLVALQEHGTSAERLDELAHLVSEPDLEGWAATDDPRGALALGYARIDWAWRARGSGYADRVTQDAAQTMEHRLAGAFEALQRAAELDPGSPAPHVGMITVGMGLGDPELSAAAFQAVLARDPAHRGAWGRMLQVLCAKWYGSDEAMFAHARSAPAGLEELICYAHAEVAHQLDDDDYEPYYCDPSVAQEILAAWRAFPADVDDPSALNAFALALSMIGADEEARAAFQRVGRRMVADIWGDWATFIVHREELGLPAL